MKTCQKGMNILKWCKTHLKTKPTLLHNPTYQIMVKNSLTILGLKRKPIPKLKPVSCLMHQMHHIDAVIALV